MGKVSELSQLIEELNRCGNTLIGISEDLKNLFSGSEEAKETEPKTKVTEETPAKVPKKEKTLSLEDVRAVMADKSRKGYTAEASDRRDGRHGIENRFFEQSNVKKYGSKE